MSSFASFAYINTRLSILASWLRDPDLFSRLLAREGMELSTLLPKAGIPSSFAQWSDQPFLFEHALNELFVSEALVLLRGVHGPHRSFFIHWLRRHEISNLKVLLRAKVQNNESIDSEEVLIRLGALSAIPLDALQASEEINEFFRILEKTHYQALAAQARRSYEETQSLFYLEAIIDRYYYMDLVKQYRQLPQNEQKNIYLLLGLLLDQIDLIWMLRYRFNNEMEPSQTYYLLPNPGRYLTKERLLELVQLDDLSSVLHNLPEPWHERLNEGDSIERIEQLMTHYLNEQAMRLLKGAQFSLGRLFAYFIMREQQLKHIAIVISGRYLQLTDSLIRRAAGFDTEESSSGSAQS